MGSLSIWHWLIVIGIGFLACYPYVRIIQRTGHSGWWLLAGLIPVLNLIMLWVFAFARWPAIDGDRRP
ncbi:hypothetical protein QCE47_01415 [Caballeronia sp. LZ025]|jgi:hypothetical protein|uniref:hypothetical protein n=1 Tax=Caballeronia TaxID=1827195 RepID=UPI001FD578F3|nr:MULTISPECIES: hypothetical protein [Caballeronia]MDR5731007.1 hypothetical protein [Caballeronia sp. LZ025]